MKNGKELFHRIITEVAIELGMTPEERKEVIRLAAEKQKKESREKYILMCSNRYGKIAMKMEKDICEKWMGMGEIQESLVANIRKMKSYNEKLKQTETIFNEYIGAANVEYDKILKVAGIEYVVVAEGVIEIFTEEILIAPDGCEETFNIGKFRIEIYMSGINGGIRFFNINQELGDDYYVHPHISKEGEARSDYVAEIISHLIGENKYPEIIQLGLQFLCSIDTNDLGDPSRYQLKEKEE